MNNILDEIELRLRAAGAKASTVADMIYTWLGDKGYSGTLGQRLGEWGHDRNLGISRVSLVATVPNPPTALLAVPGNGQVTVSFSQAYTGGSAILDYTVTAMPGSITAVGTGTSIAVTGLTNGTAYTFTVKARNIVGYSAESVPSSASTPATVPSAPTIFSAIPAPASAVVTITAPATGGSPITGYTVTSSPGGLQATGFSPVTVTGLTNGVQYTFTAVAHNSIGTSAASAPSAPMIAADVPGIPTNVSATYGDGQVSLTWTAPSDGGSAITSYTIRTVPAEFSQTSATNAHAFTGLTNGQSYQFEVKATNQVGSSAYSTPSASVIPSGVPFNTSISSVVSGNAQVEVYYPDANANGSNITAYTATSSPGGFTATGLANPLVVTGLANGTTYTFTLTATNVNGVSAASDPSTSTTPSTVPGAPTIGTATAGDALASVAFTAPASDGGATITSYTATASPGGATSTGTASPIVVTGLQNGLAHTFTVKATNLRGTGAASAASNSVTPTQSSTVPGAPTGLSAVAGAGSATVSFTPPANIGGSAITSYTVTSSPGGLTGTGASSPIVVNGLTNGTTYTFTAYATNTSGNGPQSAASNAVTPRTVPGAPTIGTAVAGNTQASVAFTPPASDGGATITAYTATSSPGGITVSGAASPLLVTGLNNGTAYTFTVTATNSVGTGAASAASNSVTPAVPTGTEGPYDAYYASSWQPVIGKTLLTMQAEALPAVATGLATAGYVDSRYGTRVYRPASTTTGDFASVSKLRHYYSRRQPFNADSSMFFILGGSRYYLFNATTFARVLGGKTDSSPSGAVGSNSLFPQGDSDLWWHPTDPNIIYFNPGGLKFYQYNVATQATTLWRDYTGRLPAGMTSAVHLTTGAEGRPSDDGRYLCLMAWTTESASTAANLGYLVVDLNTDTIVGSMVTSVMSNNVTMSSKGNFAILARTDSSITFTNAAASSTLRGTRAYSRDFSTFNQLHSTSGHSDPCIDVDGDEAWIGAATQFFEQLPWGTIFYRKCAGGLPVALYDKAENTSNQQHMSGCNSPGRPGWAIVSTYHETDGSETGWGDQGVYAVKLSTTPEIRRIAHHRGSPLNNSYWDEPHATVSPDGLSVMFASRFRVSAGGALALTEQESFIVGLPSWFYGGSAPSGFNLLSNGTFSDTSVWTNTNTTRWTISGGVANCVAGDGLGAQLRQSYAFEVGATYRVTFDLTVTAGTMNMRLLGGTTVSSSNQSTGGAISVDLVAVTGNNMLAIQGNVGFVGTVDNVVMVKL